MNRATGRIIHMDITEHRPDDRELANFSAACAVEGWSRGRARRTYICLGLISDAADTTTHSAPIRAPSHGGEHHVEARLYPMFMDGRGTHPHSGVEFIQTCRRKIREIDVEHISVHARRRYTRWIALNRWERIERAYRAGFMAMSRVKNRTPCRGVRRR